MENKEKVMFAAVISPLNHDIKEPNWKINTLNNGVPIEAVMMQLKALIKNYEDEYFDNFNNKIN